MPIFEYVCTACGRSLEVIVLPREKAPTSCAECGARLRKRWSRVGVSFHGWGFARNDALLPDDGKRKPFKQIRDKAAELFD